MIKEGKSVLPTDHPSAPTGADYRHVICDITKIVLEDGKCLYPGYVEVREGKMWQHFSDDPNNRFTFPASDERMAQDPSWNQWVADGMLRNRIEFRRTSDVIDAPQGAPDGHYIDVDTLLHGIAIKNRINQDSAQAIDNPPTEG